MSKRAGAVALVALLAAVLTRGAESQWPGALKITACNTDGTYTCGAPCDYSGNDRCHMCCVVCGEE
jgi:hypothetical protein